MIQCIESREIRYFLFQVILSNNYLDRDDGNDDNDCDNVGTVISLNVSKYYLKVFTELCWFHSESCASSKRKVPKEKELNLFMKRIFCTWYHCRSHV